MHSVGAAEALPLSTKIFPNGEQGMLELQTLVRQGFAVIVLVNYDKWAAITKHSFRGAHFVVVTGFDDAHIFVHDPLFRGANRQKGAYFAWRYQRFLDGWGTAVENGNQNFTALIPQGKRAALV